MTEPRRLVTVERDRRRRVDGDLRVVGEYALLGAVAGELEADRAGAVGPGWHTPGDRLGGAAGDDALVEEAAVEAGETDHVCPALGTAARLQLHGQVVMLALEAEAEGGTGHRPGGLEAITTPENEPVPAGSGRGARRPTPRLRPEP